MTSPSNFQLPDAGERGPLDAEPIVIRIIIMSRVAWALIGSAAVVGMPYLLDLLWSTAPSVIVVPLFPGMWIVGAVTSAFHLAPMDASGDLRDWAATIMVGGSFLFGSLASLVVASTIVKWPGRRL